MRDTEWNGVHYLDELDRQLEEEEVVILDNKENKCIQKNSMRYNLKEKKPTEKKE
jgi:hypothetical protein